MDGETASVTMHAPEAPDPAPTGTMRTSILSKSSWISREYVPTPAINAGSFATQTNPIPSFFANSSARSLERSTTSPWKTSFAPIAVIDPAFTGLAPSGSTIVHGASKARDA